MFCAKCGAGVIAGARFCSNCGTLISASQRADPPATSATSAWGVDEGVSRRQITVLFCDLVGSTVMAESMDPEDLFFALAAYHELVKGIAIRFGGHVDKIVGDGVDLFFGYPIANEDDAARAVHAGLAIADQVGALRGADGKPIGLRVRIGIATGRVAVGRMAQVSIAGTTPNLAARIQTEAQPGQVAVAPSTRRIAGTQFSYADLGSFQLKGFADEVRISAVTGAQGLYSRSAWRRHDAGIPLAGRDEEFARLRRAWQDAATQPAPGVLLQAEAGLGKSRLALAFAESLHDQQHLGIRLQCSPFHSNSVLYPFVQHLVQAAGFSRNDSALVQAEKLEAQLAIVGISAPQDLALMAALLDVRVERRYEPLEMPPPARLQMTEDVLVRYFSALARQTPTTSSESVLMHYFQGMARSKPLLILFEDLHWIDPSSLELLDKLLGNEQFPHAMLLMTARPGFKHLFVRELALTRIELRPLSEDAARQMVENLCRVVALPASAVEQILRRTDGIPLYIEEMTRMVQDAQATRGGLAGAMAEPQLGVPDTLADLLMERLDRLGPVKSLVQVAAVLGQAFSRDFLAACARLDAAEFARDLDALLHSGLLIADGAEQLRFKHALVENAAYDSILLKARVALHARVVECLLGDDAAFAQRAPEVLAHHLARADRALEASRYLLQAGVQSLQSGAPREAAEHLRGGLASLKSVEASPARSEAELGLLSVLGPTTMVLMGPGSAAFGEVQKRAYALCHELPGRPRQFPITYGLCLYHWGREELSTARALAAQLLAVAEQGDEDEAVMAAGNINGMIALHQGEPVLAREHLERSVGRYRPDRDAALYPVYLMDFGVFGRFYLALASFICGDADAARQHALDAYALAQKLNQPHSLGFSMLANFNVAILRNEPAIALQFAEQCVEFSSRFGFPEFVGMARIARGWATAMQGHPAEGLADLEAGVELWKLTGFENWQSWFACLKVRALRLLGRDEEALAEIEAQLLRIAGNGERLFLAVLLGHKAVILRDRGQREPSAELFVQARAIANEQGAQSGLRWLDQEEARTR